MTRKFEQHSRILFSGLYSKNVQDCLCYDEDLFSLLYIREKTTENKVILPLILTKMTELKEYSIEI